MLSRFHHWSQHFLAHLPSIIPSSCALCGTTCSSAMCHRCQIQFFQQDTYRCNYCAIPLPTVNMSGHAACGECLKQSFAFDATIVATDYAPPVNQLVLALKFGGRLALAPLFAQLLRDALLKASQTPLPTILTAVPLGSQRLSERGFNQALEIAKPLSRALGIKLAPYLVTRVRDTQAQAMLLPDERRKNIRHAFIVSGTAIEQVHGRHIGIVDDVMTTGETLNELAATLKRFGAVRVTNFVFARTLPDRLLKPDQIQGS
jgi:ComF family protein